MIPAIKVVDSWAVMAWITQEPTSHLVRAIFEDAELGKIRLLMSMINVAEVFYSLAKRRSADVAEAFLNGLPSLPIRIIVPSGEAIIRAARVKAAYPVAFGDAFAIALALDHGATVITGDEEFRRCGLVAVNWVGR
jgi:predicted nucleic acid-binding protein